MNLIVLAAGQGTRFYPITKHIPKALVRVAGRPLIEHVLEPFIGQVTKIIIVVNTDTGSLLEAYLGQDYFGIPVCYTIQHTDNKKGTWPAMIQGSTLLDETSDYFIVVNSDDIFNSAEIKKIVTGMHELSIGVSKATMPKKYLGIRTKKGYVREVVSNTDSKTDVVNDLFCNGLHILPRTILNQKEVVITGHEYGLPQTLFANLKEEPCRAIEMNYWISINKPGDIKKIYEKNSNRIL